MYWFSNLTIGTRLSLSSAAASSALVVLVIALAAASIPRDSRLEQSGNIIVGQLANGAKEYILEKDSLALQAVLNELSRQAIIAYAGVEDATHSVLAESHSAWKADHKAREFASPIQIHDTIVGYARVELVGTAAPLLPWSTILLLGLLVFGAAFALTQLYLQRFHSTLQRVSARLSKESLNPRQGTFRELDNICQALERLTDDMPLRAADQRAVLALRIPGLQSGLMEPARVASLIQSLKQLARRNKGELHLRADGCLLLFTTGDTPCFRALESARSLQSLLANDQGYAMAIAREEKANDPNQPVDYIFRWQQLCEQTYQLATRENSLLLCRSALSDPAVHDQVSVSQDDSGHYRVNGLHCNTETRASESDNPALTGSPDGELATRDTAPATG